MGVTECVRSWLPCSKTWMSGVFPARAGRESESSPSKVTVCREIKVMYQGPFWGTNPVLSVWQGLWPLYCQGRGGKALPHQTRFCRDHSFVGGRKIGQRAVGKDMRWTFGRLGNHIMLITFCFCSLFHVGGCHWLLCFAKANYHRALEVCAGGRLFFVIVDNEETGKALLERGQLRLGASVLRGGLILSQCTMQ